jgi:hypothetical protein
MRARRGASAVVALFVVVWLNMALQPCLMAAEPLAPSQHDCPHCPQPADHCDDGAGRCGFIDDFDYDGRSPASPELLVGLVASPAFRFDSMPDTGAPACRDARHALPRAGPLIHVRNCVYLN